jgi:hypothetical protein
MRVVGERISAMFAGTQHSAKRVVSEGVVESSGAGMDKMAVAPLEAWFAKILLDRLSDAVDSVVRNGAEPAGRSGGYVAL